MSSNTDRDLSILLDLYEQLVATMQKKDKDKSKNNGEFENKILYSLLSMTKNNASKIFLDSALQLPSSSASALLKNGLIQKRLSEGMEKYSLTLKGIAKSINMKYGKNYEDQFFELLDSSGQTFDVMGQEPFRSDETIAILSLILMNSVSENSALMMNNNLNKETLAKVFDEVRDCLRNYKVIDHRGEWRKKTSRGEDEVSACFARLNELPRKSNHIYQSLTNARYYVNIIKDNSIDTEKMKYLLQKIFPFYISGCDYESLSKELIEISNAHYTKFLGRSIDPMIAFVILKEIKNYLLYDVSKMPSSQ